MREIVLDVPPQQVITKDNVKVEVDCIVYCQGDRPVRAKYEIANYILASTKLAQTNLRNVIGEMELDHRCLRATLSTINCATCSIPPPTNGVSRSTGGNSEIDPPPTLPKR
jgi:hypothetical protein